jgi:hypothetical protein
MYFFPILKFGFFKKKFIFILNIILKNKLYYIKNRLGKQIVDGLTPIYLEILYYIKF